ncbi:glucokinase [Cupriavidus basilensis OR16]|uniref:Glucokinase n=1 Tax=Cupriavidus basilensis OR16 TaxID=1127483 RepID=H1S7Z3_9BURK|nr:glucokinase [Cupriavidus basilensis]EHP41392.1 glucokinase [Cupriavidus basilensis OR16]
MRQIERFASPRLVADIGGTNARFAIEVATRTFAHVTVLDCAVYRGIEAALRAYLATLGDLGPQVRHAAIGIATPVLTDLVKMTNLEWSFSIDALRYAFSFDTLVVTNDFTALAHALPYLTAADLLQVGGKMAGLIPCNDRYIALPGEGGHTSFSPSDDEEARVWRYARARFGHVSAERLLSGAGLTLIHEAIRAHVPAQYPLSPAAITRQALMGTDPLCQKAVEMFCAMLGTVAADLALTIGARGGVYIGGGIVPRLGAVFAQSAFRRRFENKGRMRAYLADIPVYVINTALPALAGLSAQLEERLSA